MKKILLVCGIILLLFIAWVIFVPIQGKNSTKIYYGMARKRTAFVYKLNCDIHGGTFYECGSYADPTDPPGTMVAQVCVYTCQLK